MQSFISLKRPLKQGVTSIFLIFLLSTICSCYVSNVTDDPDYQSDYSPNTSYYLQQDVLLQSYGLEKFSALQYAPFTFWMLPSNYLEKFSKRWHDRPSSREEYENDPGKWKQE